MADRVLITGARAGAALDLARDFRAAGWDVHVADCGPSRMASWSRAPSAVHRYAAPALDAAGFRRDMDGLVDRLEPQFVVPVCEEVFHLAAWARGRDLLFAPPVDMLRRLHDKLAFARLAADLGLPVPESVACDPASLPPDPAGWVFKPRFSRFGGKTLIGPQPHLLATIGEDWLAQRRVLGSEVSFYAVARAGVLLAFTAYRSDWRLAGGASFAFEPLAGPLAERLREIAGTLAGATGLSGQFACDAMVDDRGQPWLIECNPRATSGVHLLAGDGALARAMTEGEPMPPQEPRPAYVGAAMFAYGLPMALAGAGWRKWHATLRAGDDALGRPGDRLPALGALIDGMRFTVLGWRHGMSATAATTRDIEWNGEDLS